MNNNYTLKLDCIRAHSFPRKIMTDYGNSIQQKFLLISPNFFPFPKKRQQKISFSSLRLVPESHVKGEPFVHPLLVPIKL